jgi:lipase chaperone LimK
MPASETARKATIVGTALIAVLALVLLDWSDRPQASKAAAVNSTDSISSPLSKRNAPPSLDTASTLPEPARPTIEVLAEAAPAIEISSWSDADWDGDIRFDSTGRLMIDSGLRRRFDFVLTGLGEQDLPALRQLLVEQLSSELGPTQVERVLAEFDLYTAFLQAADELMQINGSELATRFEAIRDLQRELLGDERAEAWFGDQNADIARALAIQAGEFEAGDPASDPRAADLAAATGHHIALEMNRQYAGLAIDPAQRYVEREALYGRDAAERLAALDRERAAWADRLQRYTDYRKALMRDGRLSLAEIERALAAWREGEFSDSEIRRVIALERVSSGPRAP